MFLHDYLLACETSTIRTLTLSKVIVDSNSKKENKKPHQFNDIFFSLPRRSLVSTSTQQLAAGKATSAHINMSGEDCLCVNSSGKKFSVIKSVLLYIGKV